MVVCEVAAGLEDAGSLRDDNIEVSVVPEVSTDEPKAG